MAEIRKKDGKFLADGREVDFSTLKQVQKLDDAELDQVGGGIKIFVKDHWYGPDYLVCGSCGSKSVQIGNSNKCSQQIEVEVNYRTICTYHILSLTGGSY